jgi:hypothetical protein
MTLLQEAIHFFHHIKKSKKLNEIQLKHLKKINQNLVIYKKNIKLFKNDTFEKQL